MKQPRRGKSRIRKHQHSGRIQHRALFWGPLGLSGPEGQGDAQREQNEERKRGEQTRG